MARGKQATQSATSAGLGAELAVDGNTDGGLHIRNGHHLDTCTFTGHSSQHPWWRVDLEKTYDIHSVVLYNRRVISKEHIKLFCVTISTKSAIVLVNINKLRG